MCEQTNPWLSIPDRADRYVAECDAGLVDRYDELQLDVLPEPFIGCLGAPVVLLNLNPGFEEQNVQEHENPDFQELIRNNYKQTPCDFPFYYLDPRIRDNTGGGRYWSGTRGKLKRLIADCGVKQVAQKVLCIEFFPYHSVGFPGRLRRPNVFPSQEYGVCLARSAVNDRDRDALIVIMRGEKLWEGKIPELENHPRKYVLRNYQNPTVSPGNCSRYEDEYEEIRSAVLNGNVSAVKCGATL